jgi:putative FmdB family regulatory protein
MPTYDYACQHCGHRFETFQSITADPLRKCPECGRRRLQRLIGTGAGFLFRGSGFYETDYRSESYKQGAAAESKTPDSTKSEAPAASPPPPASESSTKPGKTGPTGKTAKTGKTGKTGKRE